MSPLRSLFWVEDPHQQQKLLTVVQYFCRTLFSRLTHCPKPLCPDMLDIHGDHLLRYNYGCERNNRHSNQVVLVRNDLARGPRRPFIEPRLNRQHRTRPDIREMGAAGCTDYFDVTFANQLALYHSRIWTVNPFTSLNAANAEKRRKY